MKINVTDLPAFNQPIVGNVYAVNGGFGRKAGHAMVLLAITARQTALMLVIDNNGDQNVAAFPTLVGTMQMPNRYWPQSLNSLTTAYSLFSEPRAHERHAKV